MTALYERLGLQARWVRGPTREWRDRRGSGAAFCTRTSVCARDDDAVSDWTRTERRRSSWSRRVIIEPRFSPAYADHDGGEFSAVTSEWWPLGQLSFANTSAPGSPSSVGSVMASILILIEGDGGARRLA